MPLVAPVTMTFLLVRSNMVRVSCQWERVGAVAGTSTRNHDGSVR
jgi:hypothetical protein